MPGRDQGIYARPAMTLDDPRAAEIARQLRGRKANSAQALNLWGTALPGAPMDQRSLPCEEYNDHSFDDYFAASLALGRARLPALAVELGGPHDLFEVEFSDLGDVDDPLGTVMRNAPKAFGAAKTWAHHWG